MPGAMIIIREKPSRFIYMLDMHHTHFSLSQRRLIAQWLRYISKKNTIWSRLDWTSDATQGM